jgi:hypothetical protein
MSIFSYPNPTVAKTIQAPLTAAVTVAQGDLLCGDPATGLLVAASAGTDLTPAIGFAARDYVGDGVTPIEVELFAPTWLYTFLNDAGSIAFAFAKAYVKDAQSASATSTGKPALGLVLNRTATQVTVAVGASFSLSSI